MFGDDGDRVDEDRANERTTVTDRVRSRSLVAHQLDEDRPNHGSSDAPARRRRRRISTNLECFHPPQNKSQSGRQTQRERQRSTARRSTDADSERQSVRRPGGQAGAAEAEPSRCSSRLAAAAAAAAAGEVGVKTHLTIPCEFRNPSRSPTTGRRNVTWRHLLAQPSCRTGNRKRAIITLISVGES